MRSKIIVGDALAVLRTLEPESVQCVVTSPPYWALRDYGVEGQLGLEPTPDAYLAAMTEVFREVRRVLRNDGVCFVNMGDGYTTCFFSHDTIRNVAQPMGDWSKEGQRIPKSERTKRGSADAILGLKPKDLVGMPWRLAFALQADGWWLRSDIIWHKPNPMPESVTDRPTKSHEYVFLLAKAARYYYDAEAIREEQCESSFDRAKYDRKADKTNKGKPTGRDRNDGGMEKASGFNALPYTLHPAGRNARTVWTIPTQSFSEAHFATYPEALAARCILAGTSERGACADCGAPWERVTEREKPPSTVYTGTAKPSSISAIGNHAVGMGQKYQAFLNAHPKQTTGFRPTCTCGTEATRPCVVLDPFCGSGTTGLVALRYGRNFVGIELNPEYAAMAERRIAPELAQPQLAEVG